MDLKHDYAQVNGVRLHYATAGNGPLMLFVHGFPQFWYAWHELLPEFGRTHHAVAPDMRGVNLSAKPEGVKAYHVTQQTNDLRALMRHLGHDKCIVVGHDWGGAVAWAVAARHPELVDGLVAINCPPASALAHAMRHSRAQLRKSWYILFFQLPWLPERRMAADGAAVVARALVGGSHRRDAWPPEELDAYRAAFARPGRAKAAIDWYRAGFRRTVRRRHSSGPSRRVAAPTLVLWGVEDRFLGRELVAPDVLRGVLTEGNVPEVVFIEDAGHFVQNEMPDRVNEELLRWLARR